MKPSSTRCFAACDDGFTALAARTAMRAAILVLASGCAVAEIPPVELANVSHVMFLNDCKPNGCTVFPGKDDSRSNHSSIVDAPVFLAAFPGGPEKWNQVVSCVQRLYAPYNLQLTTTDPGSAPHFELMFGGHPSSIGLDTAGGVAIATCPNGVRDNTIAFVFAGFIADADALCWVAAQESGHMFGLDHTLEPNDPMTWLQPPVLKPAFQNVDATCGESLDRPRACGCARPSQNSHEVLLATFGPRQVW
jgi:hypothetical protein